MTSLLQSVLRQLTSTCADVGEDAALLRRFVEDGDQPAFAVLVRRHGGLVWGVCRQMLPTEADAEDAFQATFLALVRSARAAVGAKALGGWLHGVAVKVCLKSRRAVARQRKQEERAAKSEGVLPGELAWDDLHAAVHEEVEKLPAAHRTALVLCDLQGVRQHDAAARLGWKIGTLTGRLARARQQLLKRLTARGLAPTAVAGAVAFGGASAAAPPALADTVLTLAAGGAIPSAVLTLTTSVLEGTLMKVKLLAAAVLTATALTLGAGGWFATADAQPGPGAGPPPGGDGRFGKGPPLPPGVGPAGSPSSGSGPGRPGMGGDGGSMGGGPVALPQPRVEHALVDLPDSEKKLAELFNKRQAEGWEFAGQVGETGAAGSYVKLAFKRPAVSKPAAAGMGGPGMPGSGLPRGPGAGGMPGMGGPAMPGAGGPGPMSGGPSAPGASNPGSPGGLAGEGTGGPPLPPAVEISVLKLKHAAAADLAAALGKLFGDTEVSVVAEPVSNTLLIRANAGTLGTIKALIEKIDLPAKPSGPGR